MDSTDPRPMIGAFPLYPPLELFHSMGFTPVTLWGFGFSNAGRADRHVQPFVCGVARQLAEFVLAGDLAAGGIRAKDFAALFMYNACDTLRNLPEVLEAGLAEQGGSPPILKLHVPQARLESDYAGERLAKGVEALVAELEQLAGQNFSGDRFEQSARTYNRMRRLALSAEELVQKGLLDFGPYCSAIMASWREPAEASVSRIEGLVANARKEPGPNKRIPVLVSGILPPARAAFIEDRGFRIAANDLAAAHRAIAVSPEPSPDPAAFYREMFLDSFPCPTLPATADARAEAIVNLARDAGARAVIFWAEKFCEYEYFEFPVIERALEEAGIKTLVIETALESGPGGQAENRLDALRELIERGA